MKITKVLLWFILLITWSDFFGQNQKMNMIEVGSYDPSSLNYNDVWGFELGVNDYAVIGSIDQIFVVDVTDCSNPIEKAALTPTGTTNVWRDFKTKDGYIYAVCDNCNQGLVIINANVLPSGNPSIDYQSSIFFSKAHNIFIDGNYLYVVGANTETEGIIILDISSPLTPTLVASVNLDIQKNGVNSSQDYYVHDINVKDGIAYCSQGWLDEFSAWDISDPLDVSYIDSYVTGNYAHSSWNTIDGEYAYVAEEVPNGLPLRIIDLLDNSGEIGMTQVGTFTHSIESSGNSTPHNPFVKGDTLYISHYQDGVKMFDVSNPASPNLIGYFDTYPPNDGGNYGPSGTYKGCWGVYPYLSSGCILASDASYGLKVLKYDLTVPVVLDHFNAKKTPNNFVRLDWKILADVNSSHMEILRKNDLTSFEKIDRIDIDQNRAGAHTYQFFDQNPENGNNFYKLRFIDFDGQITESEIKHIRIEQDLEKFVISPNPSNANQITVFGKEIANCYLFNNSGSLVHPKKIIKGNEKWTFVLEDLSSKGLYVIHLETSSGDQISLKTILH